MLAQLPQKIIVIVLTAITVMLPFCAQAIERWQLERRQPYNADIQQTSSINYSPLMRAQKPWRLCALIPHLKDAYWIGVNYGLTEQAKRLNINLDLFEAGGYYSKNQQLLQLNHCMTESYDAILLGTVSPDLLSDYQGHLNKPIIGLVNQINNPQIRTRIGVNWYQMGWNAGKYLLSNAKKNQTVALLTGPEKHGEAAQVQRGVTDAIKSSGLSISAVMYADNNRDLYRDKLNELLEQQHPNYILGSAVAIEVAVNLLHQKGLSKQIKLVSTYLSPVVLRGLFRNKVAYSNNDAMVLQGRLAVDIAVKQLEGVSILGDIGPKIQQQIAGKQVGASLKTSLAPARFYPIYRVKAQ